MARHKFQPTKEQRELVKALTGFGIPQDQICMLVENSDTGKPISEPTLRAAFRKEIDTGKATADAQVARNLHKLACGSGSGAVSAAIWWTKTRMGWKESAPQWDDDDKPTPTKVEITATDARKRTSS